ncbi:LLM class flavin-dependent oxidoreductase [Actinacidiphila guanduensis]|uniref:LLM class flavin-dependent oxidoreductase n=1 Tax=Actinacidiphila guanduensis TaxID=310781 RepID=UPI000B141FF0|nr:LLM class flavin-dependent oxidoreductase [Actinacidiphila guanduensis]
MSRNIHFGLDSPIYLTDDGRGGVVDPAQAVRDVVDEAVLADEVAIDSFNMGEHYRDDQMNTAPSVFLAAVAGRTSTIRLGTAVTVLSTQDPVRVFHDFSTLGTGSAAGASPPTTSSSPRSRKVRSMSDRRIPSPNASPRPSRCWMSTGSISSTPPAGSPTRHGCATSNSSAPK